MSAWTLPKKSCVTAKALLASSHCTFAAREMIGTRKPPAARSRTARSSAQVGAVVIRTGDEFFARSDIRRLESTRTLSTWVTLRLTVAKFFLHFGAGVRQMSL